MKGGSGRASRVARRGRRSPRRRRSRRGWDAVIKVGGSLERSAALGRILSTIAWMARRQRLLVIPGGGRYADLARAAQGRHRLDDDTAHRMALRGMDQYGLVLAALAPRARAVGDRAAAGRAAARGLLPILLGAAGLERDRTLERSFRLGSDAIAAVVARRLKARRLILLKSCACPAGPIASRKRLRVLARRGLVDALLPALAPSGCEVRLIDARATAWETDLAGPVTRPLR